MVGGHIPPDRMIPYGDPVTADDIERYGGREAALWLTDLGRLLLQAEVAAEHLTYLVPEVTDRITVPDGGVDASLEIVLELSPDRTPGLINNGRTIYQFKWRASREDVPGAAAGELKKLREKSGLPHIYVFITNIDLTAADKLTVRDRLRRECEEFPEDRIVILGAGELKDRVNADPRIRISHFRGATLGLCTWEKAGEFAERRYGTREVPSFYNRQEERDEIQRFVGDSNRRVIIIHGPQGVGKTRAVLEALSQVQDQVVWAREVPLQPTALIQVLDDSSRPTVLVVDVADDQTDLIIRKALEAKHLKVMVISSEFTRVPGARALAIRPFDQVTAMEFMKQALPRTSFGRAHWLYDQFGGLPGLLLQGAAALEAVGDRDPLEHEDFGAILDAHERTVTDPLGAASNTLTALSILPKVRLSRGKISEDLQIICEVIGVDPRRIRGDLELLRARNLVELVESPTHEAFQVTPPLLARRRARRVLLGIAGRLPDVIVRLSPEGRAGLVRRVGESAEDPAIRDTLEWLFTDAGIFSDVATLAGEASSVAALAETVPQRTARALLQTLKAADTDARRDLLADDARREVVRALDSLVHKGETFDEAAEGLLLLAEAENERWANNATGVFTGIFHWRHPEIPKDARLRARLLERLAERGTPVQRQIIAKAAGEALETQLSVWLWHGESIAPPELGWRPRIWRDVHEVVRALLTLLKRLAQDEIPEVSDAARQALARGVMSTEEVGIPEEGMSALEFLHGLSLSPTMKAIVVESVAGFVSSIRRGIPEITEADHRASREQLAARGDVLFTRMTAQDFRARFHHWLGPAPMRAERQMYGVGGFDEMRAEAEKLAQEVIANPAYLSADLLDWTIGVEAGNAGAFLWHLGRLDQGGQWREQLEARVPQMRVGGALSTYVAGWAESDTTAAGEYLDAIAGRGGNWSYAAAETTLRLGPTPQNVARLLRCVTEGYLDRRHVARLLSYGKWPRDSSIDELIGLVTGLRDGTQEVDWALVDVLEACWPDRRDAWDRLGPIAVELLSTTAGRPPHRQDSHHWDALAAQLVAWNTDVGFRLLLIHLEDPDGKAVVFLRFHRSQLLHTLSTVDRPRLVRILMTAASHGPRALEVRFELPNLLYSKTDSQTLMQLIDEAGIEMARLIAGHLDAAQAGFREAFEMLGTRWGEDEQVREGLMRSTVMIRDTFSDKGAVLGPRLALMEQLRTHQDPRVVEMATDGRRYLLEEMRAE
jgi:hypothetical protein